MVTSFKLLNASLIASNGKPLNKDYATLKCDGSNHSDNRFVELIYPNGISVRLYDHFATVRTKEKTFKYRGINERNIKDIIRASTYTKNAFTEFFTK